MKAPFVAMNIEALLAPISVEKPAGDDIRYTGLYDTVRASRRNVEAKLMAEASANSRARRLFVGGDLIDPAEQKKRLDAQLKDEAKFDFGGLSLDKELLSICTVTSNALTKQSKDLQVATWLLEGRARLDGFAGAAWGLELVRRLIETYWDTCFPLPDAEDDEPIAARVGILEWIGEKLPAVLAAVPLNEQGESWSLADYKQATQTPADGRAEFVAEYSPERFAKLMDECGLEHLEALWASFTAVRDQLDLLEKITDTRCVLRRPRADGSERVEILVSFKTVTRIIDECAPLVDRVLTVKRQAGAGQAVNAQAGSGDAAAIGSDGSSGGQPVRRLPAGAIASRDDAVGRLAVIAEYLVEQNAADPTPYLLSRAVALGPLFACADVSEAQPLNSPPTAVRTQLKAFSAEGNTEELTKAAEQYQRTANTQPWLDLQRYAVTSLETQGRSGAATAIRLMLKALLSVLPDLVDAEFADGTPVANHDTKQWLREAGLIDAPEPVAVMRAPVHVQSGAAPVPTDTPSTPPPLVEEALTLVQSKRLSEALAKLQLHVSQATSGRERFLRRLELAEICLTTGNAVLAYPVLDELAQIIERGHLEEWEDRSLVVRAWSALVRCCRQLDGNEEVQARGRDVFTKLCRVDISTALDLDRNAASSPSRWHRR